MVRQIREERRRTGYWRSVNWLAAAAVIALTTSGGWAQSSATASQPPASATLRQIAETKSSEWETLAKALDAKIARMLPCDPRVKSAIDGSQPGVGGASGRARRSHESGGRSGGGGFGARASGGRRRRGAAARVGG